MSRIKPVGLLLISAFLLASCTGILQQLLATDTPTPAQIPTISPTLPSAAGPTSDSTISLGNALWATYQNNTYGFSFDYPAIYESAAYKAACGLRDLGSSINLGARIELGIYPAAGLSLEDFARQFLSSKDWTLENQDNTSLAGQSAINVDYRFGGPNRFGTLTLIKHNDVVLALGYTSGSFCANLSQDDDEASAFQHILDTFQFTK